MSKDKLCKLAEDGISDKKKKKYLARILPADYLCLRCGRTAANKKHLCKPEKIE